MKMKKMKLGKYRHFKGKLYEVIGVARHSETLEELVVYKALYDSKDFGKNALWVRPLKMFLEDVEVDGKTIPRFRFVSENEFIMAEEVKIRIRNYKKTESKLLKLRSK